MAYIVGDPCVKCKYTDCVAVCPVECFYEGANFLAIHPDECIDCGACEPECPTNAIYEESALPESMKAYVEINAVLSGAKSPSDADTAGWPQKLIDAVNSAGFSAWSQISESKDALPGADEAANEENKIESLDPQAG